MLDWFLHIADVLLGWMLALPDPLPVVALGIVSAVLMVALRRVVTDQKQLALCDADKKRLRQLIREARRRRDKPAVKRHKAVRTVVQLRLLKAEGWPLLLSIPVIAVLGTWGFHRLEYHPPTSGETVGVELSLPPSAVGHWVTLVPEEGLRSERWVARVQPGEGPVPHGVARWQVQGQPGDEAYTLQMRYRDQTYIHPLRVGQLTYAEPVRQHDDRFLLPQSVVQMRPVRVLGIVPWMAPTSTWGALLPAWLISYVLVMLPAVYALKAIFRVH